jgi:hypothetical protein
MQEFEFDMLIDNGWMVWRKEIEQVASSTRERLKKWDGGSRPSRDKIEAWPQHARNRVIAWKISLGR